MTKSSSPKYGENESDSTYIENGTKSAKVLYRCYEKVIEFEVDDWVYRKVSPMMVVMKFGKKGKLSPRYIGLYIISKRVGSVSYELELP